MTLEERERRAYIEGRTEEAVLLASLIDSNSRNLTEINNLRRQVRNQTDENDGLLQQVEDQADEISTLRLKTQGLQGKLNAVRIACL